MLLLNQGTHFENYYIDKTLGHLMLTWPLLFSSDNKIQKILQNTTLLPSYENNYNHNIFWTVSLHYYRSQYISKEWFFKVNIILAFTVYLTYK